MPTTHNHLTEQRKPAGSCPGCDQWYADSSKPPDGHHANLIDRD